MAEEVIDLHSIKGIEDWSDLDSKTLEIMNNLLQPNSLTPREAAKEINELFLVERTIHPKRRDPHEDPQSGRDEVLMWDFWNLLIGIVLLIPYGHSGQEKLLSTVEELSHLPPIAVVIWSSTRVWTDLPIFGPCLREAWDQIILPDEIPDEQSARQWLNLNSFAARLLANDLYRAINFPVWEFRDALEEPTTQRSIMNCNVAVATEWILQGGEKLFELLTEKDLSEDSARVLSPGTLYKGKGGLCRARWDFWKTRFSEVSNQVDESVKERVLRAVQKMEQIEQSQV